MTSAFQMVDAALRRLNEQPLDQNTIELLGHLFARPGQDPTTLQMEKTDQMLRKIQNEYRAEIPNDQAVGDEDITIYCNHDRYQLVDAKKKIYRDTSNDIVLHFNEQLCRGRRFPNDIGEKIALAVTINPERKTGLYNDNGEPLVTEESTQIQLCPWFVDWIKDRKFKLHNDVARSNIGRAVIKLAESNKFGFAQIDAFSLLDKVLLHEMTHGRTAYTLLDDEQNLIQEGLIDVPALKGFFSLPGISWASYGWKLATLLTRTGDPLGGENAPDNNSDTVALFGSITPGSALKLLVEEMTACRVRLERRVIWTGLKAPKDFGIWSLKPFDLHLSRGGEGPHELWKLDVQLNLDPSSPNRPETIEDEKKGIFLNSVVAFVVVEAPYREVNRQEVEVF
ncbi:Nn.00g083490.m01.CDS01 [Neocucurbitaria sp. VM-36]